MTTATVQGGQTMDRNAIKEKLLAFVKETGSPKVDTAHKLLKELGAKDTTRKMAVKALLAEGVLVKSKSPSGWCYSIPNGKTPPTHTPTIEEKIERTLEENKVIERLASNPPPSTPLQETINEAALRDFSHGDEVAAHHLEAAATLKAETLADKINRSGGKEFAEAERVAGLHQKDLPTLALSFDPPGIINVEAPKKPLSAEEIKARIAAAREAREAAEASKSETKCRYCNGSGHKPNGRPCPPCGGTGKAKAEPRAKATRSRVAEVDTGPLAFPSHPEAKHDESAVVSSTANAATSDDNKENNDMATKTKKAPAKAKVIKIAKTPKVKVTKPKGEGRQYSMIVNKAGVVIDGKRTSKPGCLGAFRDALLEAHRKGKHPVRSEIVEKMIKQFGPKSEWATSNYIALAKRGKLLGAPVIEKEDDEGNLTLGKLVPKPEKKRKAK